MKTAWIENAVVRDTCTGNPESIFHPDIARHYDTPVPDEAQNGDPYVDGVWSAKPAPTPPEPTEAPAPVPPKVSPIEFKLLFTAPERVAIKASADAIVQDFFSIVEDPRLTHVDLALSSTQDALEYLTMVGLIGAGRKAQILTGVVQ